MCGIGNGAQLICCRDTSILGRLLRFLMRHRGDVGAPRPGTRTLESSTPHLYGGVSARRQTCGIDIVLVCTRASR